MTFDDKKSKFFEVGGCRKKIKESKKDVQIKESQPYVSAWWADSDRNNVMSQLYFCHVFR